jgi:hypothetical protein
VTFFLTGLAFRAVVFLSFVCFFLVFFLGIRAVYHRQMRAHKIEPPLNLILRSNQATPNCRVSGGCRSEKFEALRGEKKKRIGAKGGSRTPMGCPARS